MACGVGGDVGMRCGRGLREVCGWAVKGRVSRGGERSGVRAQLLVFEAQPHASEHDGSSAPPGDAASF